MAEETATMAIALSVLALIAVLGVGYVAIQPSEINANDLENLESKMNLKINSLESSLDSQIDSIEKDSGEVSRNEFIRLEEDYEDIDEKLDDLEEDFDDFENEMANEIVDCFEELDQDDWVNSTQSQRNSFVGCVQNLS